MLDIKLLWWEKNKMDYLVIYDEALSNFVKKVNQKIAEWYLPYGEFFVNIRQRDNKEEYLQAMVKEKLTRVVIEKNINPLNVKSSVSGSISVSWCLDCWDDW